LKHPLNNEYSDQCGKKRKKYWLHGDFLIHCHVEMHMMEGMAAVLRATQEDELSDEELNSICYPLPTAHVHQCPEVDHHPCSGDGRDRWELLNPSPIFVVHGALLRTGHTLLFSGAAERNYPLEARIWDPTTKQIMTGVITLPE